MATDDRFIAVDVGWGWCGLRRTCAGLCRSTLPMDSRHAATRAVGGDARAGDDDPLLMDVASLLGRYFAGEAVEFGVELDLGGLRDFTRRVLEACSRVGYGHTCSYGELAREAGSPRAARAVGQALHRNPLAIVIPCHRVIGAGGKLVGFGGGLPMKSRLLELESARDL